MNFVRKVAASEAIRLIQGESGTAKDLVAKAIHYESARQERPFVAINCFWNKSGSGRVADLHTLEPGVEF